MFPHRLFWMVASNLFIAILVSTFFWLISPLPTINLIFPLGDIDHLKTLAIIISAIIGVIFLGLACLFGVFILLDDDPCGMEYEDLGSVGGVLVGITTIVTAMGMAVTGACCATGSVFYHVPPLIGLGGIIALTTICWAFTHLKCLLPK